MDTNELIALFNPTNALNLTEADLQKLRQLTDEEITALAEAYPNTPIQKAYLVLYDTTVPDNKQLYQLSTWQNLKNVRKFAGKKNLLPHTFRQLLEKKGIKTARGTAQVHVPKKVIVDLTASEAAAELKKSLEANKPATGTAAAQRGTGGRFQKKDQTPPQTPPPANQSTTPEIPADQQFDDDES